jgi:hypothetical protein
MDARTLADHYSRMIDPATDPMPAMRAIALRFRKSADDQVFAGRPA